MKGATRISNLEPILSKVKFVLWDRIDRVRNETWTGATSILKLATVLTKADFFRKLAQNTRWSEDCCETDQF